MKRWKERRGVHWIHRRRLVPIPIPVPIFRVGRRPFQAGKIVHIVMQSPVPSCQGVSWYVIETGILPTWDLSWCFSLLASPTY